jgi:hypothetical protein
MKMSRVPTSLTAACIAAFGAKVLVKMGTLVPTKGEGAAPAPWQITIADAFRLRMDAARAAFSVSRAPGTDRFGPAVAAMP